MSGNLRWKRRNLRHHRNPKSLRFLSRLRRGWRVRQLRLNLNLRKPPLRVRQPRRNPRYLNLRLRKPTLNLSYRIRKRKSQRRNHRKRLLRTLLKKRIWVLTRRLKNRNLLSSQNPKSLY